MSREAICEGHGFCSYNREKNWFTKNRPYRVKCRGSPRHFVIEAILRDLAAVGQMITEPGIFVTDDHPKFPLDSKCLESG